MVSKRHERALQRVKQKRALGLMELCGSIAGRRFRRGLAPARSGFVPSNMFGSSRKYGTWMVKRSEIVNLGGLWLEGHGLSVGSETLGLSS